MSGDTLPLLLGASLDAQKEAGYGSSGTQNRPPLNRVNSVELKEQPATPSSTYGGSIATLSNTILGCGTLSVPFAMASGEQGGYLFTVLAVILSSVLFSTYLLLSVCDELDRRAYLHLPFPYEIDASKQKQGKGGSTTPEALAATPVRKYEGRWRTRTSMHYTHPMNDVVYVVTHVEGEAVARCQPCCPVQTALRLPDLYPQCPVGGEDTCPVSHAAAADVETGHGVAGKQGHHPSVGVVLPPKTFESLGLLIASTAGRSVAEFTFVFGGFGTLVSYLIFVGTAIGYKSSLCFFFSFFLPVYIYIYTYIYIYIHIYTYIYIYI
jgi:hypothetical protein